MPHFISLLRGIKVGGRRKIRMADRQEIFLFCPNGYGRTKLSNAYFGRELGLRATTRNWRTVFALHEMGAERSGRGSVKAGQPAP